jgi:hypothetical protein
MLQAYQGIPASVSALTEVFLVSRSSTTEPFPSDAKLAESLKPLVKTSLSKELGKEIKLNSIQILPLEETILHPIPSKRAMVYWTVSVEDGGATIDGIMMRGLKIDEAIGKVGQGKDMGWTQYVKIDNYSELDYVFSTAALGGDMPSLPGAVLRQETGKRHGSAISSDGTFPYVITPK